MHYLQPFCFPSAPIAVLNPGRCYCNLRNDTKHLKQHALGLSICDARTQFPGSLKLLH